MSFENEEVLATSEWHRLDLNEYFPSLNPKSGLGQLAIDLAIKKEAAAQAVNAGLAAFDSTVTDELLPAHEMAELRFSALTDSYRLITERLNATNSPEATHIDRAADEQDEAIKLWGRDEQTTAELQFLSSLVWAHFRGIATAEAAEQAPEKYHEQYADSAYSEWDELGMQEEFPLLKSDSYAGELALKLKRELVDAEAEVREAYSLDDSSLIDGIFNAEHSQRDLTKAKLGAFRTIYYSLTKNQDRESDEKMYIRPQQIERVCIELAEKVGRYGAYYSLEDRFAIVTMIMDEAAPAFDLDNYH